MADENAIHDLYERTLAPRLAALEGLRQTLRRYIIKSGIIIGAPFAIFYFRDMFAWALPDGWEIVLTVGSFAGIFVGVIVAAVKYLLPGVTAYANYKGRFKREIVAEIFKVVCPNGTYSPDQGVTQTVFDQAAIFSERGSYHSDDRVRGRIGQTPFEAGEVRRKYTSGSGKNSRTYTVFNGLFFHFDFNKALRGVTIVQPEGAPSHEIGSRTGLTLATFENPEFEKAFKVYTSNEVEARYVLTPVLMERLLAVREHAGRPVFLSFKENGAYLGIQYGRSLFEPGIADTTSKTAVLEMAEHFSLADVVVHELDLNTRIWTKDVDESLLHQPDVKPTGLMDMAEASAGTLTEKALWEKATASVGDEYAHEVGKAMPKPDRTRIRLDRDAGRFTIRYGWSTTFLVFILISLASIVIAASALKQITAPSPGSEPAAPLAWLPSPPEVDEFVGDNGLIWLPAAVVVGGFCCLGWLVRVRRVDVTPDAILVRRGFRPIPRRYPRSEFDAVMRLKNSVHLKRSAASTLLYPTASPNLSEPEAAWIAYELRNALH